MANIFEQFTNCLKNKDYQESLGFNSFMFCRFLGSSPKMLKAANTINIFYKTMDDKTQYEFIRGIPGKPNFIRFIKSASKEEDDEINELCKKYKVNKEIAKEYIECLKSSNKFK